MTVKERADTIKAARRCFNCLRTGHMVRDCKSQYACRIEGCQRRHHTILHFPTEPKHSDGGDKAAGEKQL